MRLRQPSHWGRDNSRRSLGAESLRSGDGSGAFLVEACRQLATRLVEAWTRHQGTRPPIAEDEDEDLLARRLVAQRCLYGVDRNPMAVDLARLSLWLATLACDHGFTFLDHALKTGDSLAGLTLKQISWVHCDGGKGLPLFDGLIGPRIKEVTALLKKNAGSQMTFSPAIRSCAFFAHPKPAARDRALWRPAARVGGSTQTRRASGAPIPWGA